MSHGDKDESIPTITPVLFDSLRTTHDAPDPSVTQRLEAEMAGRDYVFAWLKVCLDVAGNVSVETREATSDAVGNVFSDVAKAWKFDAPVIDGQPSPACSFVRLVYPSGKGPVAQEIPVPNRSPSIEPARAFEGRRIAGEKMIVPNDLDKTDLQQSVGGNARSAGAFKICLATSGSIELVNTLRSTGIPNYDRKIIRTITDTWRYSPFMVDGVAKPVCTVVTFIYTQHGGGIPLRSGPIIH